MTARPNELTPRPALARRNPPPKIAEKPSTLLPVVSVFALPPPPPASLGRLPADCEDGGSPHPTVTHVIQRTVGVGQGVHLDARLDGHAGGERQELLAVLTRQVGHRPQRALVPEELVGE